MSPARPVAFLGLGLEVVAVAGFAVVGDLRVHTSLYLGLYGLAAAGYLLAFWARAHLSLATVLVVAAVLRLFLLPGTPTLSDDYHRYLWDGRVQTTGINPYHYPPNAPELDAVPYTDRSLVNHQGVRTIYPPLAELLFQGLTRVGASSVWGLKAVFGALDLAAAGLLALLAGGARRREVLLLYLLHPLVLQETWSSVHLDVGLAVAALAALVFILRGRDLLAGVALGLGTALKLTPAVLLIPALVGRRARPVSLLGGFVVAAGVWYLPYLSSGPTFGSLEDTGAQPRFSASLFRLAQLAFPYGAVRLLLAAAFVLAAVAIALRLPGRNRAPAAFAWTATLFLLLLPVVYPWYWLTPLALGVAAGLWTPVVLGLAMPLSYAGYLRQPFGERLWATVLAYLSGVPAAVRDLAFARRRRSRGTWSVSSRPPEDPSSASEAS